MGQQQPSFQIQHATEFEVEQDDFFQVQHEEQDNKVVTPSSSKTPPPSPAVEQEAFSMEGAETSLEEAASAVALQQRSEQPTAQPLQVGDDASKEDEDREKDKSDIESDQAKDD